MIQEQLRLDKLKKYAGLIHGQRIVRTASAERMEIIDPIASAFVPPAIDDSRWRPIQLGAPWGSADTWCCFQALIAAPQAPEGVVTALRFKHRSHFELNHGYATHPAGPEGQVFVNGKRLGAIDKQHHIIHLPNVSSEEMHVAAVFYAGRCPCRHELQQLDIVQIDKAVDRLWYDLHVSLELLGLMEPADPARQRLFDLVEQTILKVDLTGVSDSPVVEASRPAGCHESFRASILLAQKYLTEGMAMLPRVSGGAQVRCVGHAHLDLAWLWPVSQARHKCVRTFATQMRLLEQYPDWVFMQSSPQAYQWVAEDAPDLFEQIRDRVASGRWEAEGAMWVEADTNIPNGESLVRQFLYGKRYFQNQFGIDSRMLWLPDVFGYSAALPQLAKLAGVESFVTSKISWSRYNRFPHDTFRWRGIDGTEITTHFITTPCEAWWLTYNAMMTPSELARNWREYRQKHLLLEPLMTFGFGDGGGGPTEQMLEIANRLASEPLSGTVPKVRFGTAGELMDELVPQADRLPAWDGELYLELHRGTYTSQAWIKRANRKNEMALHQAEWLASLASKSGYKLDKPRHDQSWQDLLLLQFHDILPGTSVKEVYDDARMTHDQIAGYAAEVIQSAAGHIAKEVNTAGYQQPVLLLNTLPWDRNDPVEMPDGTWRDDLTVPAGGWVVVDAAHAPEADSDLQVDEDGSHIASRHWQIKLDEQGRITSLLDRRNGRQVLKPGTFANTWLRFEDRPEKHDAWDIDFDYQQHPLSPPTFIDRKVIEQSASRVVIRQRWQLPADSVIVQDMVVYARNPRIDFQTEIDWHLHHQLLKVSFDFDIRATEAVHEIQFGHIRRPTHRNTSWDMAKFETCAQRFVDLSEYGYGVSLLNDCKYGHDIHEATVRLTCIKSAQSPDPTADQGKHLFTYALLPHEGDFQEAGVIHAAAELNVPVVMHQPKPQQQGAHRTRKLVWTDSPAVIVDTLKPAEDGHGIVVRLYEAFGSHASAKLYLDLDYANVTATDLLEQPIQDAQVYQDADAVIIKLRPFEVKTLKLT